MTPSAPSSSAPSVNKLRIDRTVSNVGKKRTWRNAALVAVVAVAILVFALRPGKTEVQVTSVITTYPSQQYAELTASGYVVAQRRAAVATKATGRLVWLNVREGSQVKQGEVLARLDASDVNASVAAAEAVIRQAEASVAQAIVERNNAEADLKRSQELQTKGYVSVQSLDTLNTRVKSARAAVTTAEASVAVARAQLNVQKVSRDYTEIRAPFDGVVLVKNANVGDIITPFSNAAGSQGAVITMADMSTLEVEADVSESNLGKATIGRPVEITLDALPDSRFRGSVVGIVPTVDRAKATVMTKIRFEKLDPRILPEMSAKVTILSQAATDADQKPLLAVNPKALLTRDGKLLLFRIKDDTVESLEVIQGRKIGDNVEISGALASGDKVVLTPSEKLTAGAKVSVSSK